MKVIDIDIMIMAVIVNHIKQQELQLIVLTMIDLSYMLNDMTKDINTTAAEFKIIENSKDEPSLKQAQEFVGGYVEGITFPNGDYLIINEEGKLIGLPLNPEATALWRATFDNDNYITGRKDFVVGPAILIKKQALKTWAE
jgi:hypothetical protein